MASLYFQHFFSGVPSGCILVWSWCQLSPLWTWRLETCSGHGRSGSFASFSSVSEEDPGGVP